MKKKKRTLTGIAVVLIVFVVGLVVFSQSTKWSEKSFEAIVQETVTKEDGENRLIVERTSDIYGNPVNALGISKKTKLLNAQGKRISIADFQPGNAVKVSLKDAFTEEIPFYYPTVYEIRMIDMAE